MLLASGMQNLLHKPNETNLYFKGTFNREDNLFTNQFNIALNLKAATSVFDNVGNFKKFAIIPTGTTQRIMYKLGCFKFIGLNKRFLGFNGRLDALDVARKEEALLTGLVEKVEVQPDGEEIITKHKREDMPFVVADLTGFLCAFSNCFKASETRLAGLKQQGETLLLTYDTKEAELTNEKLQISVYDIPKGRELVWGESDVCGALSELNLKV